jgi:hypothetical protein
VSKPRNNYLVLLALIVGEALLYSWFYQKEIGWFPAPNYDQNSYLIMAYSVKEHIQREGLVHALWYALVEAPKAAGALYPMIGGSLAWLFGGARLPALATNFIGFVVLQAALFATLRHFYGAAAAFGALGLLLTGPTAWFFAGGIFDFRMDFLVYCLWGTWACLVLRSGLFEERGWVILTTLVAIVLVLVRFFTLVYFIGVMGGLALTLAAAWWLGANETSAKLRGRLINMLLSLCLLCVAVLPVIIGNWRSIANYYIVGHFAGDEGAIRAAESGIASWWDHLRYYPGVIAWFHTGRRFIFVLLIVLAAVLVTLWRAPALRKIRFDTEAALRVIFLAGCVIGPLVPLTIDVAKSVVVASVVIVPLIVLLFVMLSQFVRLDANGSPPPLFAAACALAFAIGCFTQVSFAQGVDRTSNLTRLQKQQWINVLSEVNRLAHDRGWREVILSVDEVSGEFNHGVATTWGYERSGILTEFYGALGARIFTTNCEEVLRLLAQSHIVILTDPKQPSGYPFAASYRAVEVSARAWIDENMIEAKRLPFGQQTITIFVQKNR